MRTAFGLYAGLRAPVIWAYLALGLEVEKILPLSAVSAAWTGNWEGSGKFLLSMVDDFYPKKIWIRMSQWYFGFIMFLEKHYTYIDHTCLYHLLTQGQILLDLLPFSLTKRSRSAITLENKRLLFLDSFLHIPCTPGKFECNQEEGDVNTG